MSFLEHFLDREQQKPEVLAVRQAAKTRIFEVQEVDLRFANGAERTYERLTPSRKPAVMVLPVENGELIMVREYAVGPERYELTCVKGLIDAGETPEQAARRELQEEIGLASAKLTPLRALYSSPSHMFGLMHVFIAEDLRASKLEGDEPEPLVPVRVPLVQLDALVGDEALGNSQTLAALMLLQRKRPELFQAA